MSATIPAQTAPTVVGHLEDLLAPLAHHVVAQRDPPLRPQHDPVLVGDTHRRRSWDVCIERHFDDDRVVAVGAVLLAILLSRARSRAERRRPDRSNRVLGAGELLGDVEARPEVLGHVRDEERRRGVREAEQGASMSARWASALAPVANAVRNLSDASLPTVSAGLPRAPIESPPM